jgi:hypothetical protein
LSHFESVFWLLLSLALLLLFQRLLHREIQAVFLLVTRRLDVSQALFALLFFPGVLLHELSHYLAARLLMVRTGRFSLIPRAMPDGRLQLGYVETARADLVRDALIGVAPLVAGGLFVAYSGQSRLGLLGFWETVRQAGSQAIPAAWGAVYQRSDFWLWLFLAFTVSSTMFPSRSDRRAWLPIGLAAGALLGLGLVAGAGPWMLTHLAPLLSQAALASTSVLGLSFGLHLLFLLPFMLLRRLLERLTGLEVA